MRSWREGCVDLEAHTGGKYRKNVGVLTVMPRLYDPLAIRGALAGFTGTQASCTALLLWL